MYKWVNIFSLWLKNTINFLPSIFYSYLMFIQLNVSSDNYKPVLKDKVPSVRKFEPKAVLTVCFEIC